MIRILRFGKSVLKMFGSIIKNVRACEVNKILKSLKLVLIVRYTEIRAGESPRT